LDADLDADLEDASKSGKASLFRSISPIVFAVGFDEEEERNALRKLFAFAKVFVLLVSDVRDLK
jgi:hypothetical protein